MRISANTLILSFFGFTGYLISFAEITHAEEILSVYKDSVSNRVYLKVEAPADKKCPDFRSTFEDIVKWSMSLNKPVPFQRPPVYICSHQSSPEGKAGQATHLIELTGVLPAEIQSTINRLAPCNGVNCRGTVRRLKGGQKYTGFCSFTAFNDFLSKNCEALSAKDPLLPGDVGAFSMVSEKYKDTLKSGNLKSMPVENKKEFLKEFYSDLKVQHAFLYVSKNLSYGKNGGTDLWVDQNDKTAVSSMAYQFNPLDTLIENEGMSDSVSNATMRNKINPKSNQILIFFRCQNSKRVWEDQNYHKISQANEQAIQMLEKCTQDEAEIEKLNEVDEAIDDALDDAGMGPLGACDDPYEELEPGHGLLRQIKNTQSALTHFIHQLELRKKGASPK